MEHKNFVNFRNMIKIDKDITDSKVKCKCGHTQPVPYSTKYEYVICSWCGGRIYRDSKKQKVYDENVKRNDFFYKLNKCIEKSKKDHIKKNYHRNMDDLDKISFTSNDEYFKFCNDNLTIKIYFVETSPKNKKITVYYGKKRVGRPRKNGGTKNDRRRDKEN